MKKAAAVLVWHRFAGSYRKAIEERLPDLEVAATEDLDPLDGGDERRWPGTRVLVTWRLPDRALERLPDLEWIHATGAGVDHLLERPDLPPGVRISRSLGRFGAQVAEYTLGYILHLLLGVDRYRSQQRRRAWQQHARPLLADRTVGVVGLGSLGSEIARRLVAFGATVVGVRRGGEPLAGVSRVVAASNWHEILPECQVLVLAAPLTDATRRMVDAEALASLPPGAVLVNVSRGGLIDEGALLAALRSGRLGAAVLDVFEHEPLPPDHPLWTLENAWITPHIAAPSEAGAIADEFAENWRRWHAGEPLRNEVDRQRGY